MNINLWSIIFHVLNALVLYFIVGRLVYRPVVGFLNKRAEQIKSQREEAQTALEEARKLKKQYDAVIAESKQKANDIVNASVVEAEKQAETIRQGAIKSADEYKQRIEEQISMKKRAVQRQLSDDVADMAVQIASKILEREVSKTDNADIVDEFFKEVG
jgi:F-type H+-transporting ATPase subunit b